MEYAAGGDLFEYAKQNGRCIIYRLYRLYIWVHAYLCIRSSMGVLGVLGVLGMLPR